MRLYILCAQHQHKVSDLIQSQYLHRFKLYLADDYVYEDNTLTTLPVGLTPQKAITDYLGFLMGFALDKLCEQWGTGKVTAKDVVSAMIVPAAWSDIAKQTIHQAAVDAGLVTCAASRFVASGTCPFFC